MLTFHYQTPTYYRTCMDFFKAMIAILTFYVHRPPYHCPYQRIYDLC